MARLRIGGFLDSLFARRLLRSLSHANLHTFHLLPALLALFAFAGLDRWKGDGQLWRAVSSGLVAGLLAAVAYDVFRLPFVFAKEWGIESVVPPMKLFKVFPRFGAMVLGQLSPQSSGSTRRAITLDKMVNHHGFRHSCQPGEESVRVHERK